MTRWFDLLAPSCRIHGIHDDLFVYQISEEATYMEEAKHPFTWILTCMRSRIMEEKYNRGYTQDTSKGY